MAPTVPIWARATAVSAAVVGTSLMLAQAADPQVERGRYLTSFGGCLDCHTAGYFFGKPDMDRYLGGSMSALRFPDSGSLSVPI